VARVDYRRFPPTGCATDIDLSQGAMRVATAMLVEGVPELPLVSLESELSAAGVAVTNLKLLLSRGVLRDIYVGSERLVTFFHQTFFEHAAAMSLLRLGGPKGLFALAERWRLHHGNLFLGAVLERTLVLSEYEAYPVKQRSAEIMLGLPPQGPAGMSILVYAFVHRRSVPDAITELIRERVQVGDTLVTERLLGISGNAAHQRRSVLIGLLGHVVERKNSRWIRRAMELLLRFSSPDIDAVAKVIKSARIGDILLAGHDEFPQGLDLFLEFLMRNFHHDPDWTLSELGRHVSHAFRRGSEATALQVLQVIYTCCKNFPDIARIIEERVGRAMQQARTSGAVAELFGQLLHEGWRSDATPAGAVIRQVGAGKFQGLSLTGRLNGLVPLLLDSSAEQVSDAFRESAQVSDSTTRVMLGRLTWARFFPLMIEQWPRNAVSSVTRAIKAFSKDAFEEGRDHSTDIVFHAISNAPLSRGLVSRLLTPAILANPQPWLQMSLLGRHLVQGVAENIPGAKAAFAELVKQPSTHKQLSRAALAQMRNAKIDSATLLIGLELAARTANAESSFDFLEKASEARPEWHRLVPALKKIVTELRSHGNIQSRRQAIRIEVEMIRLELDPSITWEYLTKLAQTEPDDANLSFIARAFGLLIEGEPDRLKTRLSWFATFSFKKTENARSDRADIQPAVPRAG
jgi:hypothetical protein